MWPMLLVAWGGVTVGFIVGAWWASRPVMDEVIDYDF